MRENDDKEDESVREVDISNYRIIMLVKSYNICN